MAGHYVGIDLGGTNMQIGVVEAGAAAPTIVATSRAKTGAAEGLEAVLGRLVAGIDEACKTAGVKRRELKGVGLGAPSPIDATNSIVLDAVNLRWSNVPLAELLSKRLEGIRVTLDNDVNAAVWGEYRLGAGRGYQNLLGVWVGTGIGGGLVFDGRLYHGTYGTAGEIGHCVIVPGAGPAYRTLEEHGARSAIVGAVRRLIAANRTSVLSQYVNGRLEELAIVHVAKAIAEGDEVAIDVAGHAAEMVGVAAANAVTLLSLDAVILGGGGTEALGDWFVKRVRAAFDEHVFPDECKACAILATQLRENAGLLGAALLAMERLK